MVLFSGFPKEGQLFLVELAANNNRDWFEANKKRYIELLQKPAVTFIEEMGTRLQQIFPDVRFDTKTNGSGSLMRVNRDTRFSADKTPYKTNIAMMWWQGAGKKTENPGFGMQIGIESAGLMSGMFGFTPEMLNDFRNAVLDDTLGRELVEVVETVKAAGSYQISGEHYKTVPRGFDKNHPRADFLRYVSLHAYSPEMDWNLISSQAFLDVCFDHFVKMAPIQQWLVKSLLN